MDPFSALTGLMQMLQFTVQVIDFGQSVYGASREHSDEVSKLTILTSILPSIESRLTEARKDPESAWQKALAEQLDPPGVPAGGSPLRRLRQLTEQLQQDMAAWDRSRTARLKETFLRHFKRDELDRRFADLVNCWQIVDRILTNSLYLLAQDSHKMTKQGLAIQMHNATQLADTLDVAQEQLALQNAVVNLSHDQISMLKDHADQVSRVEGYVVGINDRLSRQETEQRLREESLLRTAILKWLSPLEYLAFQDQVYSRTFPTGDWLLQSKQFELWCEGRPWQLRCYGDTGTGKTCLASIAVNHLQQIYPSDDIPILCIYLNRQEIATQTPENIYGSLVKQFYQQRPADQLPDKLRDEYLKARDRATKPTLKFLKSLFSEELKNYLRAYLVIDGLDEASHGMKKVVEEELNNLCADNLSLLVTSGAYDGLKNMIVCTLCGAEQLWLYWNCNQCQGEVATEQFDMCEDCKDKGEHCRVPSHKLQQPDKVDMQVWARDEDLESYIWWRINEEAPSEVKRSSERQTFRDERKYSGDANKTRLARKLAKTPALLEAVPKTIIQKSKGRFLLAQMYMDDFVKMRTTDEARRMLDRFPDTWQEFYEKEMNDKILGQKDKADQALALKILMVLTCARRPLTLPELKHALGIQLGDKEVNLEKDYDKEDILEVTKTLINVDDGDDQNAYVRFYHLTLQDYLYENRAKWFKTDVTASPEAEMAALCLTCVGYDALSKSSTIGDKIKQQAEIEARIRENPFAAYALQFWGDHLREDQYDATADKLATDLLRDPERVKAYVQAAYWNGAQSTNSWDVHRDVDPLHITAWFGLLALTTRLIVEGHPVDVIEGMYGQTPLIYACRNGHVEVMEQLLNLSANINASSRQPNAFGHFTTPLLESIKAHHEKALSLLLSKPQLAINALNEGFHKLTPLMAACTSDYVDLVPALLARPDIDVNVKDDSLSTALTIAAGNGAISAIEAILEKPNVEIDCLEKIEGQSPLMVAVRFAEQNMVETVRTLLKHGANPNIGDKFLARSAMARAIESNGRTKPTQTLQIVEEFLKNDKTDLRLLDNEGKGLLHYACQFGDEKILQTFLRNGLDINLKDKGGSTPLHTAVQWGGDAAPEMIASLLLNGADPKLLDAYDNTAQMYAAIDGEEDLVNAFKAAKVSELLDETAHKLSICTLVKYGHRNEIAGGITSSTLDLNEKDPASGNTALHLAVLNNQPEILAMLLEAGMNINSTGQTNVTPLHLAAMNGKIESLTILLAHGADRNVLCSFGTPLTMAERHDRWEATATLIEAGAMVDPSENHVQRLFFEAIRLSRVKAVRILLDLRNGAPDPSVKNEEGLNARQLAKLTRDPEMIRLMSNAKSVSSKIMLLDSQTSSYSSVHSMPSPPTTFLSYTQPMMHSEPNLAEFMVEEPEGYMEMDEEELRDRVKALSL